MDNNKPLPGPKSVKPPLLPKPNFLISPSSSHEILIRNKARISGHKISKAQIILENRVQEISIKTETSIITSISNDSITETSVSDIIYNSDANQSFLYGDKIENNNLETVLTSTPNKDQQWDEEEKKKDSLNVFNYFYDASDSELGDTISQNSGDCALSLGSTVNESIEESQIDKTDIRDNDAYLTAKEFMSSEKVYVEALNLIIVLFKDHIENYSKVGSVIPKNELDKVITSPLPELKTFHKELANDLEERINNWKELPKIADVIVKKVPFLKLYSLYMKNFETVCAQLDECCVKYPKFAKALNEFEASPVCKKLSLKHYMLKPVQRIPQYRLLLQKYLEYLDEKSTEYTDAKSALTIVQNVLDHANSSIKLGDNLRKLLKLQGILGNYELIKPGREFIKEGDLLKLSRKERQLRYFILLSDCLLYTTYTTSITGLRVKYELPLSGMKVYVHEMDHCEFNIITSTRSFTLQARNEEECSDWVKSLHSAIKENTQKQLTFLNIKCMIKSTNSEGLKLGKEAPIWIQDKSTTMCQVCTAEFTVTFRRHHCRCCGKVVCGICSSNKAPIQYLKFNAARVCEECYDYLLREFEDPESKMCEIVQNELKLAEKDVGDSLDSIKQSFKKFDNVRKVRKFVPQRLKEVTANDSGSEISGWLHQKGKRGWKRLWFVLKDRVLYVYKATHDVVAYQSIPVLGYTIKRPAKEDCAEDVDPNLVFMLTHPGQSSLEFSAQNQQSLGLWISALQKAINF